MNQFRFAHIEYLYAMWGVLVIAILLVGLEFRGSHVLERLISPIMQSRLVHRPSLGRRLLAIALFSCALCCLVLALMRPQWGSTVQAQSRVDSQIMLCLDVSKSMLAEDVVPNRLERAKAEIDSLLGLMSEGQQVGLLAFAGRASVLCPMTTDFGFLRLVLAEATPQTIGLGGTRIGDAIRKALDGFGEAGDINRMLILITDGEDHDSFPLDAAKAAKQKGVRIVSVGFGDEAGSRIEITDTQTGLRSVVKDRSGKEVLSRLDGETLREIALETQGAYIPAGTGALDLQSIYDAHIADLLKGSTQTEDTVVRNEAYQWCLLAALLFLVAALAAPTLLALSKPLPWELRQVQAATCLLVSLGLWGGSFLAVPAHAQEATETQLADKESTPVEPRVNYNRALALMHSDPDSAEELLDSARREAGVDGELRFRALYNLGWVEVEHADALLESDPEKALQHLEISASRFREAIRVRPASSDARHNLEIVSRRILALADMLAKKNDLDMAERLDELIVNLRSHQAELQDATQRGSQSGLALEQQRSLFRDLGVTERQLISEVEKFTEDARREMEGLKSHQPAAGKEPDADEAAMKAAQLDAMLAHVDGALQRMNKARSFARRLQAERAFVRWSASLTDAKRARDQMRSPIEVLSLLIGDGAELASLTSLMDSDLEQVAMRPPAWLSDEYLSDTQISLADRIRELNTILTAATASSQMPDAVDNPSDPQTQAATADRLSLLKRVRQALPAIEAAELHFRRAQQSLEAQDWKITFNEQSQGLAALQEAAEAFFDVRRLIEAAWQSQLAIQEGIRGLSATVAQTEIEDAASEIEKASAATWSDPETRMLALAEVADIQARNLERSQRLKQLLDERATELSAQKTSEGLPNEALGQPGNADTSVPAAAQTLAAEKARVELAYKFLENANLHMQELSEHFEVAKLPSDSNPDPTRELPPSPARMRSRIHSAQPELIDTNRFELTSDAEPHAARAVAELEELRRLYFSVVEHLRETAQRQLELSDGTQLLAGTPEALVPSKLGPLGAKQKSLQTTAVAIGEALEEQATATEASSHIDPTASPVDPDASNPIAAPNSATAKPNGDSPSSQADEAERLRKAAGLVKEGSQAMGLAALGFPSVPEVGEPSTVMSDEVESQSPLKSTIEQQQIAVQKLLEALELLNDPKDDGQDPNQGQQNQPQQERAEPDEQQSPSPPQNMNAEQMLQAIREREANRRQEKQPHAKSANGSVEKDW